jgi:hypothetical protein
MVRRYVALADTDVASRHDLASPADHLLGRTSDARTARISRDGRQAGAGGRRNLIEASEVRTPRSPA